ncbi:unnamed protein product, partial [Closterium sp. Yama58-4]
VAHGAPISGGLSSARPCAEGSLPLARVRRGGERHECCRLNGYPFRPLVDFTTDADGHPVFLLSSLGMHACNLQSDPRCTVVVQIPGWSGLANANARATIVGDLSPPPPSQQ